MTEENRLRVLVAEDDFLVNREIVLSLVKSGHEVVGEASNGREAVEMAQRLRPDVILMDIEMPEMDGLTAADTIQSRCPTPIVILTAYESKELVDKASKIGVGGYLIKPPDSAEIGRSISIAMGQHEALMECRRLYGELELAHQRNKMLMKEMHHRVKNNLSVIQSLLRLQSGKISDETSRRLVLESGDRVRAMAMIHEHLYQTEDLKNVDFSGYLHMLVTRLFSSHQVDHRVRLVLQLEDVRLDLDTIIPCGLITNELVSNALKHAFPGDREGELVVTVKAGEEGSTLIIVKDNGTGLPDDFDIHKAGSLGMQIVGHLTKQIDAELEVLRNGGTEFRLLISEKQSL